MNSFHRFLFTSCDTANKYLKMTWFALWIALCFIGRCCSGVWKAQNYHCAERDAKAKSLSKSHLLAFSVTLMKILLMGDIEASFIDHQGCSAL